MWLRFLLQLTVPSPAAGPPTIHLVVDGVNAEVPDDGSSLLEALRDRLGRRSPKDGCSPQGQCGCCTVLVDGQPRVACVTATRRVAGRAVTTFDGLDEDVRARWTRAFTETGASQCGFCTPGIIVRLAGHEARRPRLDATQVGSALAAHLCRCTGWRSIFDAARLAVDRAAADHDRLPGPENGTGSGATTTTTGRAPVAPDRHAARRRAVLEGGTAQAVGAEIAAGQGGFADDSAPTDALVAVLDGAGEWVVGSTVSEARARAGRVPGRNSTVPLRWPLDVPPGDWALRLQTTFVEPAYLEPDASWCVPGGEPHTPLANGGAFGGKVGSPVAAAARRLADEHGRPVRTLFSREDVVRFGPKRPPVAVGVRPDGSGSLRVGRTPGSGSLDGWRRSLQAVLPELEIEEVAVSGPPVSAGLRAAGWAEGAVLAAVLQSSAGAPVVVSAPGGGRARAEIAGDGAVRLVVRAGDPLDETVLRSYCVGATHQALGWVRREGVALDEAGQVVDRTIRSFGILTAREMPPVEVEVEASSAEPTNASDAVFAAVAAAAWRAGGLLPRWPLEQRGSR